MNYFFQDVKVSSFTADLSKKKPSTMLLFSKMPHIIPHSERVMLFRKYVSEEKIVLGLKDTGSISPTHTLITVHRYDTYILKTLNLR